MKNIKNIKFFTIQYLKHLQKKWKSLLLLFLFPIFITSLVTFIIISLLNPSTTAFTKIALVDLDQTEETKFLSKLLRYTFSENENIEMTIEDEEKAANLIEKDEISVYIVLPREFTENLYKGVSVTIPIVGNENRLHESFIVKELVESFTRYIESAQANILTVYDHVIHTDMPNEVQETFFYDQFIEFALFTLGNEKLLDEEVISNIATSSPKHYFTLSSWFIAFSIWLLGCYVLLRKDEPLSLNVRLKLLGITKWQNVIAQTIVSFIFSIVLATITFLAINYILELELYTIDYIRLFLFISLYGWLLLIGISLIGVWSSSRKITLLLQTVFVLGMLIISGAIIPAVYLPMALQNFLPYMFPFESFNWIVDIALEGRNYAEYHRLIFSAIIGVFLLWSSSAAKERWVN